APRGAEHALVGIDLGQGLLQQLDRPGGVGSRGFLGLGEGVADVVLEGLGHDHVAIAILIEQVAAARRLGSGAARDGHAGGQRQDNEASAGTITCWHLGYPPRLATGAPPGRQPVKATPSRTIPPVKNAPRRWNRWAEMPAVTGDWVRRLHAGAQVLVE